MLTSINREFCDQQLHMCRQQHHRRVSMWISRHVVRDDSILFAASTAELCHRSQSMLPPIYGVDEEVACGIVIIHNTNTEVRKECDKHGLWVSLSYLS